MHKNLIKKLESAIRKRKVILNELHDKHALHMARLEHYRKVRHAEQFEAHIVDMRLIEDRMESLLQEISTFSSAIQKMGHRQAG